MEKKGPQYLILGLETGIWASRLIRGGGNGEGEGEGGGEEEGEGENSPYV